MEGLNERIREFRNKLHLSQEYVANYLGIKRTTYTLMELGKREVHVDELSKLSSLFGVSSDELLNKDVISEPTTLFARSFEKLSDEDQAEILSLMKFKEAMKGSAK